MADVLPTEPAVEARLHEFLAGELRQAELDFPRLPRRGPSGDRRRLRIPAGIIGAAVVVVAVIALEPRFPPSGTGGTGPPPASESASRVAPGSSAISALPSPSVAATFVPAPTPTPKPSAATGVLVDCGGISREACATAIDLVRAEHEAEVARATRIVMADTCPPPWVCDRLYPFDSIVVFVTAGADTTGWYAYSVVGLVDDTPTTVKPWVGDIPAHVLRLLTEATPST